MNTPERLWAVVPAAGVGSRMGASVPKQYLPLAGKTVLQITLEKLLQIESLQQILVCVSPTDTLFDEHVKLGSGIRKVPGGQERCDSVKNALQVLMAEGCSSDWVLVHDAARPCFSVDLTRQLITKVNAEKKGAILAAPAADTIKQVEGEEVVKTVDRSVIYLAHTPQIFKVQELLEAIEYCQANNIAVTDESSAMEAVGCRPSAVKDSGENIKITRPEDLQYAEFVLQKYNQ